MDTGLKNLRLRQMDDKLQQFRGLAELERPNRGWVRAIRMALGMTASQLSARLGISQQAVGDLERREVDGSVTLATLSKAADALSCDVVYALVPREGLEATLRNQARIRAAYTLDRVAHSMRLEAQAVAPDEHRHQVKETAEELVRSWSRSIWDPATGER